MCLYAKWEKLVPTRHPHGKLLVGARWLDVQKALRCCFIPWLEIASKSPMAEFSRELPFDYDPDSQVGDSTRSTVRACFTTQKLYKISCIPLSMDYNLQQARAYFSKDDYYQTIFSLASLKKFLAFQNAVFYNSLGCDCWTSLWTSPRRQHECAWFLCRWPA